MDWDGAVDTNVLLRLFLNDVPEQYAAVKKLLYSSHSPRFASDVAVVEFAFALENHYKLSREDIAKAVVRVLSLPQIKGRLDIFSRACTHFVKHPALSFADCYLEAHSHATLITPLWTFDKKLAHQLLDARLVAPQ